MDADDFNREYPVGTLVRYYPVKDDPHCIVTNTRTPAWKLGSGVSVVSVVGYAGGVSLDHIHWMGMAVEAGEIYQLDAENQLLLLDGGSLKVIRKLGRDKQVIALTPQASERMFDAMCSIFARAGMARNSKAGDGER